MHSALRPCHPSIIMHHGRVTREVWRSGDEQAAVRVLGGDGAVRGRHHRHRHHAVHGGRREAHHGAGRAVATHYCDTLHVSHRQDCLQYYQ